MSSEELAMVCLQSGNEAAWTEFVERFHPLIARVVLRVARQWGEASPEIVDDLVQETYLKFCEDRARVLRSFSPSRADCTYAYIKVFTANLAHDHFKSAHSQKRGGGKTIMQLSDEEERSPVAPGNEAQTLLDREVLIQEVRGCLDEVASGSQGERDRRIFWLYYRSGLTASAIASLPTIGLSTKGVESTLLRLTKQIRAQLTGAGEGKQKRRKLEEGIPRTESF
jgi:RNA polymerase sigma-70 factor (ECF subfamily)